MAHKFLKLLHRESIAIKLMTLSIVGRFCTRGDSLSNRANQLVELSNPITSQYLIYSTVPSVTAKTCITDLAPDGFLEPWEQTRQNWYFWNVSNVTNEPNLKEWILIFDNLLKHPSGKASKGCRCDMCLRLKPPIVPASPTSPRLFSHHRPARSISGIETGLGEDPGLDDSQQFSSLTIANNFRNGEKKLYNNLFKAFFCIFKSMELKLSTDSLISVRLSFSLTGLYLTRQENRLKCVCSKASNWRQIVQWYFPPTLSVICLIFCYFNLGSLQNKNFLWHWGSNLRRHWR